MKPEQDILPQQKPVFLEKTLVLKNYLQTLSFNDLKKLLVCNDSIAELNYHRYQTMDLNKTGSAALLTYDGIQYQYMAPQIFEQSYFEYIEHHLRILSGFYGILRPLDDVACYRLEMQAKLKTEFCTSLYDYWKDDLYKELVYQEDTIINLASQEYSKIIEKYLTDEITYITCHFGQLQNGKLTEKGVYVKMARGAMVRFMAENKVEKPEELKNFCQLGFSYHEQLSDSKNYIYLMQK